jgi:basic amino acid/polyamine antiporter, APA family
LKRQLGTLAVSITIIGYVVGASIFILPGQLAGAVGPGVVIAYAIGAVIAAFSSVAAAQLGSIYPKTGAGYIAMAKLVSPMGGFLTIWLMLAAYIFAIALVAYGFADYFVELFPAVSKTAAAFGVVIFFGLINLFGVKSLVSMQTILVFLFMLALFAVSTGGLIAMDSVNLTPFVPNGMHPVILAVLPAFFSYGGFMCIMEIAGEIKNPSRTIPLALIISFVVVVSTYMALVIALVGSINWQELASMNAPITRLAEQLFGHTGGLLITIAAVGAAATSINALILVTSRDIIALANDGVFSRRLAVTDEANSKPTASVLLATVLAVGALLISETVLEYAVWVTAATMLYQVILGLAMLAIWSKAQQEYQASAFRLGHWGLITCGTGLILISLAFLALVFWDSNARILGAVAYMVIGIIYYLAQARTDKTKGLQQSV